MSNFPLYLIAFVVVLGVLVIFHELGHYLAARYCNVKVLRFSMGFGPTIFQRKYGVDRTEWAVAAIPLGGFVKMLDEREGEVTADERHRAFNRQTLGKRSLIVVAGPLANFALAILLYWAVFMHGGDELLPVLGPPPDSSPAAMAGIRNGDQVRSIDGQAVASWDDFRWLLLQKATDQESVQLEIINQQQEIAIRQLALAAAGEQGWEGDALGRLGILFFRPNIPPVIGKVAPGEPADQAGIRMADEVLAINGVRVATWFDFVQQVRESDGNSLRLEVNRGGQVIMLDVIPKVVSEQGHQVGKVGVAVAETEESRRELRTFISYGFFAAGAKAIGETWDKSVFTLAMMGKMLTGEVSLKNISGPVTIADYAGQSARLGLDYYLKFMALLSISLGVLNLLPIPVLDGGHLLYYAIEAIRRRPLSERAMELSQRFGLAILFTLMAFAFFNDINRLVSG